MNPNNNNQISSPLPPESFHQNSYLEQMGDYEMQMMPPHMPGSHPKMPNGAAPYEINSKLTAEQRRQKNKRRSKNDQEGRTHKCSLCDKTYLSYPALYTHLKTKHADAKGQDGQPLTPLQSGRGRGRPKKNVDPLSEDYFKTKARGGGPTQITSHFQEVYGMIYPITIFKSQNNSKESVFNKIPREYGNFTNHPLYKILRAKANWQRRDPNEYPDKCENLHQLVGARHQPTPQQYAEVAPAQIKQKLQSPKSGENFLSKKVQQDKNPEEIKGEVQSQVDQVKSDHLEENQFKSCDQLICEYLEFLAANVNADYYKSVLKFALLYRECLNDFGWQKKYESISRTKVDDIKKTYTQSNQVFDKDPQQLFQQQFAKLMEQDQMNNQFVIVNNGQYAPQICNQFVTFYWENFKHTALSREDAIDLTRNFCSWLFINNYTCSKLTIINQVNGDQNSNGIEGGMEDEIQNQDNDVVRSKNRHNQDLQNEGSMTVQNSGGRIENYSSLFHENPNVNNMVLNDEHMQQQKQITQNDCLIGEQVLENQEVVDDRAQLDNQHEMDDMVEMDQDQEINFEGGGESG